MFQCGSPGSEFSATGLRPEEPGPPPEGDVPPGRKMTPKAVKKWRKDGVP